MANINHKPSKYMLNLLHVLPPFVEGSKKTDVINAIVEINAGTIGKYEIITESGQLKLDRVGYSSLAYPSTYGAIPGTLDYDNDALDILILDVTEPLIQGCLVEARVIGVMKFTDDGEKDDKIIAVLSDDKRMDHVNAIDQIGEHTIKEIEHFFEHYKDLKKPGTCKVEGFFGKDEAIKVIKECEGRYKEIYLKNFE